MEKYRHYFIYCLIVFFGGICTFYVKQINSSNNIIEPRINTPKKNKAPILITIHLAGAVKSPGVYKVVLGSRIIDILSNYSNALKSAHLDKINLAKIVKDGQRIYIPLKKTNVYQTYDRPSLNTPININIASRTNLQKIPGIGKKIASEIISYRKKHGFFYKKEDLLNVKYIGSKFLKKITPYITI